MHAGCLQLWSLIILSLYSTFAISILHDRDIPRTYWYHISCMKKKFLHDDIRESLIMAARGAAHLMNEADRYQPFVFQKLFGRARDTRVAPDGTSTSATWNVIG